MTCYVPQSADINLQSSHTFLPSKNDENTQAIVTIVILKVELE